MKPIFVLMITAILCMPVLISCNEEASSTPQGHEETGDHDGKSHGDPEMHGEGDHDHADDSDLVVLSRPDREAAGITLTTATLSETADRLELPAEIRANPDKIANLSSPVSGIVTGLPVSEGETVTAGEALVVISSPELAGLKADYLASLSAEELAQADLAREETLYADEITAEADLLNARATFRSARASRESAETKLHALGIGHDIIDRLSSAADGTLAEYSLAAPIAGQVIRRDLTMGQSVEAGSTTPLIVIVDTSTVWADITVYKQDLSRLAVGNAASLRDDEGNLLARGEISFISPVVEETSRTATARLVLDNPGGMLRPGQFVTAHVEAGGAGQALLVPEKAVQLVEGRSSVFVPVDGGFRSQPVETGRRDGDRIEIVSGLQPGASFVSGGAFTLKAELEKDAFGDGHNH